METTYADSWSDMAQPCDMDLWAYMWYLPISEGAPYILPIFWENLPSKISEFSFISYTSPYLEFKVSLPKFENFLLCLIILPIWKRKSPYLSFQMYMYHMYACGSWSEGQHDLYFTVQWLCLISWRLFDVCMYIILWEYELVWLWPQNKCTVGHRDLYFMVQWFCLISWRLFDVWTSLFGILSPYDPMFNLKINVGHCDLYFMVK